MKKISIWKGGLLGGFSAAVVVALNYLASQLFGLPRFAYQIFDWMSRVLPGDLITFSIDTIVMVINTFNLGETSSVAKLVEQGIAIFMFILMGVVLGGIMAWVGRRETKNYMLAGLIGGALIFLWVLVTLFALLAPPAGMVASILWSLVVSLGWGYLLALTMRRMAAPAEEVAPDPQRRQFLRLVGIGSFTVLVTAAGVRLLRNGISGADQPSIPATGEGADIGAGMTSGPAASPPQAELDARFEPPPGTRPELTANENFYRIDINTMPPAVDGESWQLELTGLVDQPLALTLEDLRSYESISQAITLECISNPVGGDLISSSIWTGVPFHLILEEAGLQSSAQEVYIESVDGFYESVPLSEAMDERTLLVYEMNGEPLPQEHGFPLRIYIPNHFGMKQPKWITRMEVIDHEGAGYWVDRGWSATAIPKTTSVVDVAAAQARTQNGEIPVAGIAFAGDRGIERVEVRVDGGEWQPAELRTPPLSPLTWVQWRYFWPAQPGRHTFEVRAYDGTGELQETQPMDAHPEGATGIDSLSASIPENQSE